MSFPIVAIGASAGGLEAVSELLAALPASSDMAYVLIQHLDPQHASLLVEILSKKTKMPVEEIREGLPAEPAHVYVIPPNVTLTFSEDRFHLAPRASGRHHPVDVFFTSLAEARADAAIGVVLSGGDADGTLGVQSLKQAGGIAMAQSPESARFPGMPKHAIETDCVDFIGTPSEIAHELARLGRHPYLRTPLTTPQSEPPEDVPAPKEEDTLRRVFRRLRSAHGVDFTHYKRSTLRRRLARRMALRKVDKLTDYVAVLEGDPSEAAALYQDFLIRVTGFFRDPESFDALREIVFPSVCEGGRTPKDPIRIWVPGCASGEEVYSIAIALVDFLGERLSGTGIQVFGTDVSEAAVEKARTALYPDSIAEEVSAERLQRFFVKEDHHYRIAKSLRDLCIFARQDVTRDPPFSRLDLVSCRNLLIYLDAPAQRRVMQLFHYALRPKGYLLLGPSESTGTPSDLFELLDKQRRIYARKIVATDVLELGPAGVLHSRSRRPAEEDAEAFPEVDSAQREADRLLLARFAPASLLVDEALNIVQVRGETGPYLELSSGQPSLNLNRLARPELLVEIAPAIQEARASGAEVRREGLRIDQRQEDISIEVIPLKRLSAERCYLLLFYDGSRTWSDRRPQLAGTQALPDSEKDRRIAQLQREVSASREYLQATMEEHEAVKEELKSAHEEVLSANEEFQSTNEELETAKEELQSSNEELTTTNDELRNRNHELSVLNSEVHRAREVSERARAYAEAIINTVREPLIVLNADLRILRANPAFYADFRARRDETEGRPLTEVNAGQWNVPSFIEKLRTVMAANAAIDNHDLTYALADEERPRTLRVNARKIPGDSERSELILLSIEDVSERQANAERLREDVQRKDEFLAMLAHELRNPLTPIAHAIHLLRGDVAGVIPAKLYELIERQTTRLTRLVDDLLDVARISRGHIELRRNTVDLCEVVHNAVEASRARLEERQHSLSVSCPEEPVCVDGDPIRLEQIVSNLLENAGKYTNRGGRIELTLRQVNGHAHLSVRDNGIGLAPGTLESIFDLFTQIDTSVERAGGGLGIGLTLVRRILALHGGTIEAHSAGLGHGTQFVVRLPVAPSKSRRKTNSHAATGSSAGPAHRVLIVDDNADSGDSLALLVGSWGHEVAVARDGPSALELAQTFRPERALVDIGLPGMNGYELGRRLRAAHRHLYLVAMTGYGRDEDRKAAAAAGFDLHLVKPADLEELQALLATGGSK